ALVVDDDALEALTKAGDYLALLPHLVFPAEDAEVLVHRLGELVADRPRALALGSVEQAAEVALGVGLDRRGHLDRRVRECPLRGMSTGPLAEGDRLHQGVSAESVCAVDGHAGAFAGGVQAFELGAAEV